MNPDRHRAIDARRKALEDQIARLEADIAAGDDREHVAMRLADARAESSPIASYSTQPVGYQYSLSPIYTLPLSTRFARVLWLGGWCPRFAPINPNLGDVGRAFVRDHDGTDPGCGVVGGELCVFV